MAKKVPALLTRSAARVVQSAVAWNFLSTGLRVGGMILVLPVVLRALPPAELGLWYVFLSIGALVWLMDAGFNPTVARVAGYLWAGARELRPLGISIPAESGAGVARPNFALLATLRTTMRCYYWILAGVVLAVMLTAGSWWIWMKTGGAENRTMLRAAWIAFSITAAWNTFGAIWPALLAGINGVRQAEQLSFFSLLANYLVTMAGLALHGGIWALVMGQFAMAIILRVGGKVLFERIAGAELSSRRGALDWQLVKTLWPMAWRNGAVSIGAFLILNANTLICSAYLGLVQTASYGLTVQVIGFLLSVSIVWLNVKLPLINQLRVSGSPGRVAALFITRIRWVLLTYLLGAAGVLCFGHQGLELLHARTGLIPFALLGVLLFIYFLELQHTCYATLVTSENLNPFVAPALISGLATVALSLVLTPRLGLWGMVISFGAVQLCCNNWWPVVRGIRGLDLSGAEYWRMFFSVRKPPL